MSKSDDTDPRDRTTSVLTPPTGVPATTAPRTPSVPSQRGLDESNPLSGPITAVPRTPGLALCTCGHAAEAHEHYRAGDDCGACGPEVCGHFSAANGPDDRRGLFARLFGR
jgi:hypothetical protein